jgi:hypothetical protein
MTERDTGPAEKKQIACKVEVLGLWRWLKKKIKEVTG